jgi:hypothetical protein
MQDPDTEIKAIEHGVTSQKKSEQQEPNYMQVHD